MCNGLLRNRSLNRFVIVFFAVIALLKILGIIFFMTTGKFIITIKNNSQLTENAPRKHVLGDVRQRPVGEHHASLRKKLRGLEEDASRPR